MTAKDLDKKQRLVEYGKKYEIGGNKTTSQIKTD